MVSASSEVHGRITDIGDIPEILAGTHSILPPQFRTSKWPPTAAMLNFPGHTPRPFQYVNVVGVGVVIVCSAETEASGRWRNGGSWQEKRMTEERKTANDDKNCFGRR